MLNNNDTGHPITCFCAECLGAVQARIDKLQRRRKQWMGATMIDITRINEYDKMIDHWTGVLARLIVSKEKT